MIQKNSKSSLATDVYDAIVIGSGMGGLTAASLLAQVGKRRVLVVEKHFKLGGFTHSFRRKHYEWDPGLHYVGQMQPGSMTRNIMDLVTGGKVQWHSMGSPFERFVFPGTTIEVPDDPKLFEEQLCDRYPQDRRGIQRYFRDMKKLQGWVSRWFVSKQFSPLVADGLNMIGSRLAAQNTQEYLEGLIQSPELRAVLTAQWPDYGTIPQESALAFHAAVTADFFQGGSYPVGGAKEIANQAATVIESHGGNCLVNHDVKQILVRNGVAYGVQLESKGEKVEYHAPIIISNAGAATTFNRLLPAEVGQLERAKANRLVPGPSANILYLGLNDDPGRHGFDQCNYWIYENLDYRQSVEQTRENPHLIDGGFLSFGSLRNPGQLPHTAQIVSFSKWEDWSKFDDSKWKQRGAQYEELKIQIGDSMLDLVERTTGKIRHLIDYQELSTPLSVKSFTSHSLGLIYGQACDSNRLFDDRWQIQTSVRNLLLTGADVGMPGVNAALMAGVMTAAKVLGLLGLPRIFYAASSQSRHPD